MTIQSLCKLASEKVMTSCNLRDHDVFVTKLVSNQINLPCLLGSYYKRCLNYSNVNIYEVLLYEDGKRSMKREIYCTTFLSASVLAHRCEVEIERYADYLAFPGSSKHIVNKVNKFKKFESKLNEVLYMYVKEQGEQ
jgi:hypothetical protein